MLDINPQFHIHSRKIHPDVKIKLKKEIEVFLEKNPESNVSDLRRFLKLGSTGDLIAQFKKSSFSMFLKRNYEKFKETGSCSQHKCGNGRKKTAARTRAQIKALVVNKKKRSFIWLLCPILQKILTKLYAAYLVDVGHLLGPVFFVSLTPIFMQNVRYS